MHYIGEVSECTLCKSCIQACNNGAIELVRKYNGFLYPQVNINKCLNCGKCLLACPQMVQSTKGNGKLISKSLIAYNNNYDDIKKSASGGIMLAIAEYVISTGGICVGAAWNDSLGVDLVSIDTIEGLNRLTGSKYVQSDAKNIYIIIKEYLEMGKSVFMCALPCQIAAAKTFLYKEYDNFISADIVCHGCSSEELFKRYLNYYQKKSNTQIISISHTDKKNGWTRLIQRTIRYESCNNTVYVDSHEDPYLEGFLTNLYYKEACYSCRYNSLPREGDFTLGDCFGVGAIKNNSISNEMGMSHVLINTEKGNRIFEKIKDKLMFEEYPLLYLMFFNHNIWRPSMKNSMYEAYKKDYSRLTTDQLVEKYYNNPTLVNKRRRNKIVKRILGDLAVCRVMLIIYLFKGTLNDARKAYIEYIDELGGECENT